MGWLSFISIYLLGGITFIPLLVLSVLYFSKWYLPTVGQEGQLEGAEDFDKDNVGEPPTIADEVPPSEDIGVNVHTTAWVTVSREYFIYPNGGHKDVLSPPEPAANDTSMGKSESAYSSLYKLMSNNGSRLLSRASSSVSESLADSYKMSNKSGTSTPSKSLSRLNKYLAVLKHGNILLYADAEETKVKHVIVVANHVVLLWPRDAPDAELFIKRSAICLAKRDTPDGFNSLFDDPKTPPRDAFYLYLDNCSEKEDFYHALIRASKRSTWNPNLEHGVNLDPSIMAVPLKLNKNELMDLIVNLHASESTMHSRWFNALLGRLLLNLKDTQMMEERIRKRIIYKLSRIKRPNFLGDIEVNKIHTGSAAPYFTNMKLKDLTPEGLFVMEANVSYSGNFCVEIATKVILNLGSRFKARDMSVVLAVTLKNLEGKLNITIKPPPSNRIWYSFETMPKLNLLIEPVVSSKQITYSVVTKAIESRIRELFREGLVYPAWDDVMFFGTKDEFYRGGIWNTKDRPHQVETGWQSELRKPDAEESVSKLRHAANMPVELTRNTSAEVHEPGTLRHRSTDGEPLIDAEETPIHNDVESISGMSDGASILSRETGLSSPQRARSTSRSTEDSDFRPDEHIGELRGFGYTPEPESQGGGGNFNVQTAKNLVGSVKKWGSWYFKEKIRKDGAGTTGSRTSEETISEQGSFTKQAPLPHEFPPELMHMITDPDPITNPYAPPPEMKLPQTYPLPGHESREPPVHDPPSTFAKRKPVESSEFLGSRLSSTQENSAETVNVNGERSNGREVESKTDEETVETDSNGVKEEEDGDQYLDTNDTAEAIGEENEISDDVESTMEETHSFDPSRVFQLQNSPRLGLSDESVRCYSLSSPPLAVSGQNEQTHSSAASVSSHSSSASDRSAPRRVSVVAIGPEGGREGLILQSTPPIPFVSTSTSTAASHLNRPKQRYNVKRKQVGEVTTELAGAVSGGLPMPPVSPGSPGLVGSPGLSQSRQLSRTSSRNSGCRSEVS